MHPITEQDQHWMQHALELAKKAENQGEVPVGAILVLDDKVIGEGWNQPISTHNPVAHAEVIALQDAASKIENYRLPDTTLYVTLEPCTMCVGAIVHSRVKRLVFGAYDLKTGAVCSQLELLSAGFYNHQVAFTGGVLQEECAAILSNFFSELRSSRKRIKK